MTKQPKRDEIEAPTWMYSKDGAKLFQPGDTIPAGYVDTPAKVKSDGDRK